MKQLGDHSSLNSAEQDPPSGIVRWWIKIYYNKSLKFHLQKLESYVKLALVN